MVYIILGTGFEEIEAIAPGDILRRAQIPMQYVGVGGRMVTGAHNIAVQADITVEEMDLTDMDMLVLPGGSGGVASMEADDRVMEALRFALDNDIFVSAICAAPTILGKRGWLDGRHAVCYPGMEDQMGNAVMHPDQETVVDGKIITGRAPGAAIAFGLTLAGMLPGAFTPDEVSGYMVYERR